jgi:hypothetical protein
VTQAFGVILCLLNLLQEVLCDLGMPLLLSLLG